VLGLRNNLKGGKGVELVLSGKVLAWVPRTAENCGGRGIEGWRLLVKRFQSVLIWLITHNMGGQEAEKDRDEGPGSRYILPGVGGVAQAVRTPA
jgi:hypothetical protein